MSAPWPLRELAHLWALVRNGDSLAQAAQAIGRFAADCDYALWTMLGRSPAEALEVLRGQVAATLPAGPPPGSALGRFLQEVMP